MKLKIIRDKEKIYADKRIRRKRIRDSIYGYITILPEEQPLLECSLFSRLSRIRQLNNAWSIYPGGLNTRYLHSLGVMHLAGTFAGNILHRSLNEIRGSIEDEQIEGLIRIARFWGLIHDIGHGPFSHAFEYFVLYEKDYDHESIVPEIYKADETFKGVIENFVNVNKEYYGDLLSSELILDFFIEENSQKELQNQNHEILFILSKLIKGDIYSIDEIDYLLRDSYFCGTQEYGTIDWKRLMYLSWIIKSEETNKFKIILEDKAKQSLINYYWSKYFMYNAVYYHNRCLAVERNLKNIFTFLKNQKVFDDFINNPKDYHKLDDYFILNKLRETNHITDATLKSMYETYYLKLIDLYNFKIPYAFVGKKLKTRIGEFFKGIAKKDKIKVEKQFQDQFNEKVNDLFLKEIAELRTKGKKQLVELLEKNKKYFSDIFFHHIRICANERYFLEIKRPYKMYMLNERMVEKEIIEIEKEFLGKIPFDETEVKIFMSNKLHKILLEYYPDMFNKILKCFEDYDKEPRKIYSDK